MSYSPLLNRLSCRSFPRSANLDDTSHVISVELSPRCRSRSTSVEGDGERRACDAPIAGAAGGDEPDLVALAAVPEAAIDIAPRGESLTRIRSISRLSFSLTLSVDLRADTALSS